KDKKGRRGGGQKQGSKIQDLLKKGEEILVQITKDAISTKGPRLTNYVSIPGHYLVLMPGVRNAGISRQIPDGEQRTRLKQIARRIKPEGCGIIMRTASPKASEADLELEAAELKGQWDRILIESKDKKAPSLIYG